LYLSAIMDLFSRKLIGWRCDDHFKSSLIIDAFKMALNRRNPSNELLLHSDRGIQYVSNESRAFLQKYNIQ